MIATKLYEAVTAVCPIDGVSIGRKDDKSTWRVDFKDEATAEQRAAARAVVDTFVFDEAAEATRVATIDNNIATTTVGPVTPKTVAELKAMTWAEFSAWFDANFTTNAQLVGLLKRLTIIVVRKVL